MRFHRIGTMPPPGGATLGNISIQHERTNLCLKNLWELRGFAPRALQRMRWRPTLVQAFWKQAGLVDDFHYYCEIFNRYRWHRERIGSGTASSSAKLLAGSGPKPSPMIPNTRRACSVRHDELASLSHRNIAMIHKLEDSAVCSIDALPTVLSSRRRGSKSVMGGA